MVALLLSCHLYIYEHFLFNYNKICVLLNACNPSTPEVMGRRMVRSSRSSLIYMIFGFNNDINNFDDLSVHWVDSIKYRYIATITTTHFQNCLCLLKYSSLCLCSYLSTWWLPFFLPVELSTLSPSNERNQCPVAGLLPLGVIKVHLVVSAGTAFFPVTEHSSCLPTGWRSSWAAFTFSASVNRGTLNMDI